MAVKPISPDEVVDQKRRDIPDVVIETWNRAIAMRYTGRGSVRIKQDEIVTALMAATENAYGRREIFDRGWLDIEELYRANGWQVQYDKPGYNENYEAYYEFSRAR